MPCKYMNNYLQPYISELKLFDKYQFNSNFLLFTGER